MPIEVIEEEQQSETRPFGSTQETGIVSLAFDEPEFFVSVAPYLNVESFRDLETKYVYMLIDNNFIKHGVVLSRDMCRDLALKEFDADSDYQGILDLIDRKSDPREVPVIKETLVDWARDRAYAKIYSTEMIEAYERGEYGRLVEIIESASKISDFSTEGLWFFDQIESLFQENKEEKFTTGFDRLDSMLNEGGPTRKDVLCWMAPTGVGKSILLVNTAIANLRRGSNVLFVTLELSEHKTALRFMGAMTDKWIKKRFEQRQVIENKLRSFQETYKSKLAIFEFAADEISIDTIYSLMSSLRKQKGFQPDVVIIDYLELMLSRNASYNKEEYIRQKRTSTELRQLSKKENVFLCTASQTNRQGTDAAIQEGKKPGTEIKSVLDLNKIAESYGKAMPMDYIITVNQTKGEYAEGRENKNDINSPNINAIIRFFVAKNRNGPKFKTVNARVNYETMKVKQEQFISE